MTARARLASAAMSTLLSACATAPLPAPETDGAGPVSAHSPTRSPAPTWTRSPVPDALASVTAQPAKVTDANLSNGLRVVIVEQHQRPLVSIRLVLPQGTTFDEEEKAGRTYLSLMLASDFREKSADGRDLSDEKSFRTLVAEAGGAASFSAEHDACQAGISGYATDAATYLKLLAGAVTSPRHGAESLSHRRMSALDGLEDLEVSDPETLGMFLAQAAFGVGHPYSLPIVGTTSSLKSLSGEEVFARQAQLFVPRGATLVVVGDVVPAKVLPAIRTAFGGWRGPAQKASVPVPPPPSVPTRRPETSFIRRQPAKTLVACASRPLSDLRGSRAALELLTAILGDGVSSRLSVGLREAGGVAYAVDATILQRRHAQAFMSCAWLNAAQSERSLHAFRDALSSVGEHGATEQELVRAKAVHLARLASEADTAQGLSASWVEALSLGQARPPTLEERRAAVEAVTLEEIQRLAKKLLAPESVRWILSGEPEPALKAVEAAQLGKLRPVTFLR
ncbi:MAG: pitrilysin family protein [Myxococcales bacterium]